MFPEFLKEYKPDGVIVVNPTHCSEIQQMLSEMEVDTELISLQRRIEFLNSEVL
jgi:hypothetical protein